MARAKRTTARAEARRRHRAGLVDDDLFETTDEAADEPVRPAAPRPASAPPARPGLGQAFRASFRPIDVRGDLAALPSIVLRSKAVWLPALLTAIAAVVYVTTPGNIVGALLFNYFVYIPPVASIFLAGFLAPRASYLTGGIAGLIGAVAFAAVAQTTIGQTTSTGAVITRADVDPLVAQAFLVSPLSGLAFGGAAGWYRRFLLLANPNRARQQPPSGRSGRNQPRRDERRPMLARRSRTD